MRSERAGVAAAVLSSALGGTAAAITRYVIGATDPVTLAAFRFGIGFLLILPIALALRSRWPQGRDWVGVGLLGVFFFALVLRDLQRRDEPHHRRARLARALHAAARHDGRGGARSAAKRSPRARRSAWSSPSAAWRSRSRPASRARRAGAWRGDLIMAAGTLCMAFYNVWSRPFMARSSLLGFLGGGDGFRRRVQHAHRLAERRPRRRGADLRPGAVDGGDRPRRVRRRGAFYLWVFALQRTTPTRVANTMTVNPIAASPSPPCSSASRSGSTCSSGWWRSPAALDRVDGAARYLNRSRSFTFQNLPVEVRGIASRNSKRSGSCHLANFAGEVRAQLLGRRAALPGLSTTQASGRSPHFASGDRDHRGLLHRRVRHQQVLHVDRADPLAARLDQVLGAVGDAHVAVRVDRRHVAGAQPAVGGELAPARAAPRGSCR